MIATSPLPQQAASAPSAADDLSAIAWVQAELRRTLEASNKSLRRYWREAESIGDSDLDSADPAPLAAARQHLHQAVGALEMLCQPALAQVLRASETAVQRIIVKPALLDAKALELIERNAYALLDYLGRQLAGKPVSPVMLFPQYRAVQQLAAADRVHPADLSPQAWQWRALPTDRSAHPRRADDHARTEMETLLLTLMRQPDGSTLAHMSDFCADLAAGAAQAHPDDGRAATFWKLAAALFEAQAGGLLKGDLYVKRVTSRLLAQLRISARGQQDLSDRLAQDLLFFCQHAAAPNDEHPAPRLAAVRQTWPEQTAAQGLVDYEAASLGRFDPSVLVLARKRLASSKDVWSAVAGGELHRLGTLSEAFALVDESVRRTLPDGQALGAALCEAATQTAATEAEPAPALAMEVATSLLYLDACLEDGDFDHPELPARVGRLAQRIRDVAAGADPQPLETWMEELYRRVSDRQTMGSVVQELRASLSEVEKHIDHFFRQPEDRNVLVPVPQQLSAMRGVLSVLGMSQASQAVLHMRDDVDELIRHEGADTVNLNADDVERLADNLGALSFLIDMLSVQPQLAKSLFKFDASTGKLSAVMGHAAAVQDGAKPFMLMPAAEAMPHDQGLPAEDAGVAADDEALLAAMPQVPPASLAEQVQSLARSLVPPEDGAAATSFGVLGDEDLAQRLERLSQQAVAADEPELARTLSGAKLALASAGDAATRHALRGELARGLLSLRAASLEGSSAGAVPVPFPPAIAGQVGETDVEMRDIFIEEAREVLSDANDAMHRLAEADHNAAADMTQLRRAFHTLKGSGRMVGLNAYGEAAWACEQLYNARLAEQQLAMDAPLRAFTTEALDYLSRWTEAIAIGQPEDFSPDVINAAALALRAGEMQPTFGEAQEHEHEHEHEQVTQPESAHDENQVQGLSASPTELKHAHATDTDEADEAEEADEADEADEATVALERAEADLDAYLQALADSTDALVEEDSEPTAAATVAGPDGFPSPSAATVVLPFELNFDESGAVEQPQPAAATAASSSDEPEVEPGGYEGEGDGEGESESEGESEGEFAAGAVDEAESIGALSADPRDTANNLASRVPFLPSAADLDLSPASRLPDQALHFEFDLQHLGHPAHTPPLQMTTELPGNETANNDGMPLAGTLHIPEAGLPPDGSLDTVVLGLAELDVPPDANDAPPDTTQPLLPSDPPATAPLLLDEEFAEESALDDDRPEQPPADGFADLDALALLATPDDAAQADEAHAERLPLLDPQAVQELQPDPQAPVEEESVKVIGPLRIGIPLFNIFLNEADELSRRLGVELAEWGLESEERPMADSTIALAHSLAGNSATVGYTDLSALGRALEHALMRSQACGCGREGESDLFIDAADEVRRLLHQFAAGFLRPVSPELMERLAHHERWPTPAAPMRPEAVDFGQGDVEEEATGLDGAAVLTATHEPELEPEPEPELEDQVDLELFPIFQEEAEELLPQLQGKLRDWAERPQYMDLPSACMRTLHTFKGGARLAGAMRLGEMAHQLEAGIEDLMAGNAVSRQQVDPLLAQADAMSVAFAQMCEPDQPQPQPSQAPTLVAPPDFQTPEFPPQIQPDLGAASARLGDDAQVSADFQGADESARARVQAVSAPERADTPTPGHQELLAPSRAPEDEAAGDQPEPGNQSPAGSTPSEERASELNPRLQPTVDWERFKQPLPAAASLPVPVERASNTAGTGAVRVRAGLLDRLVNQAGEVSITRARIDADVRTLQGSLHELTESLDRMRRQLRDIELQAETQISSRMEAAKAQAQAFDPLEMDRFTRFQELTRFMAESVNDVATVQRSLQRTLQSTEDELAAQARLTRELQEDLLRTRMVEFESMADRLYRTVRQAAKESGKQARLEIVGGAIEVDRGVLERMTGPFEHLLRNSVAHGVEATELRRAVGKTPEGHVVIQVTQSGNEVAIEFSDDGGGLDLPRIRARAVERGMLAADQPVTDEELAQFIFAPGFSTVTAVTELAGRGVGMDVVRSEVNAMGGRIEVNSQAGHGTRLRLLLPLTTAVTQVVMLRSGVNSVAVPSTLVEVVRRVPSSEIDGAYDTGHFEFADEPVPFFWLPALLSDDLAGDSRSRSQSVVIVRSASQRVALHVDEVVGNQEVVVKNVGPQLARLPGLAGVTLLPSGVVSLIYNPVGLVAVYGDAARAQMRQQGRPALEGGAVTAPAAQPKRAPMVMVVDDSLTVRRVTQRLLVREGYRVVLAKDGLEALEKLAEERPMVLLSDIEMPRMDGFDLLRNVRADAGLAGLPVVMITSRIAQKHRDYATELGVDHYLGKPYSEELLLSLVARYCGAEQTAPASAQH